MNNKRKPRSLEQLLSNKEETLKNIKKLSIRELICLVKHFWIKQRISRLLQPLTYEEPRWSLRQDVELLKGVYKKLFYHIENGDVTAEILAEIVHKHGSDFAQFIVVFIEDRNDYHYRKAEQLENKLEMLRKKQWPAISRLNKCINEISSK